MNKRCTYDFYALTKNNIDDLNMKMIAELVSPCCLCKVKTKNIVDHKWCVIPFSVLPLEDEFELDSLVSFFKKPIAFACMYQTCRRVAVSSSSSGGSRVFLI